MTTTSGFRAPGCSGVIVLTAASSQMEMVAVGPSRKPMRRMPHACRHSSWCVGGNVTVQAALLHPRTSYVASAVFHLEFMSSVLLTCPMSQPPTTRA